MSTRYILLFIIFVVGVTTGYFVLQRKEIIQLDVINPVDVNAELVDESLRGIGLGHKVQDFTFLNQLGQTISQRDVAGKVYVVDYFFTTCPSICPVMTDQMSRIQEAYFNEPDFLILSHTVWPEVDTVEQLLSYAKEKGINAKKWHLLTGNKRELYKLARQSYFVLKPAEAENLGDGDSDFIHTNNFVLVDRERRIRGYYDGTNAKEVDKLIGDIKILLKEK
jgi:protein SCO1/2